MKHPVSALVVFASSMTLLPAQTGKEANLICGRYTVQPGGMVLVETGILSVASKKYSITQSASYAASALQSVHGITPATLTAVNGKYVAFKATVDTHNALNPSFLSNYKFSSQSYNLVGGASYIVTFATGGTTSAAVASVSITNAKLTEGAKKKTSDFVVTLNKAAEQDIAVTFKFTGSAKSVEDYTSSNSLGILKIKKGKKSAKVTVTVRDNKLKEPTEKLVFTILSSGGYKLGKKTSATLTILDNDKK